MNAKRNIESITCPYCRSPEHRQWAEELGYSAVRCNSCAFLYVNPRPTIFSIDAAVRTGAHGEDAAHLNVRSRRLEGRVGHYAGIFERMFDDFWKRKQPISWLDVGAGYGEILEAVASLAHPGSQLAGLEPMEHKAKIARARGLNIIEDYLRPGREKVDVISVVDVFSHIPDFGLFLQDVAATLRPGGEIFVETGNLADLENRADFPGELGLPDHLVFAGESHLTGFLERSGFEVVRIERRRIDGLQNLVKNVVKKVIGRPAGLAWPYTSKYRQLLVRARLREKQV